MMASGRAPQLLLSRGAMMRDSRFGSADRRDTTGHRVGLPRDVDVLHELPHLVDLDPRAFAVAHVHEPIVADAQTVHSLHPLRIPLPQELAALVDHGDAVVAAPALAVGHVDVAVLRI